MLLDRRYAKILMFMEHNAILLKLKKEKETI